MLFIEIRCMSNLLSHNLACCGFPEMGFLGGSGGLFEKGQVYGHLWWVILSNLLEGLWGVALKIGIFEFWTTFGCFGGCGGLGMCCGPEIIGLLCV